MKNIFQRNSGKEYFWWIILWLKVPLIFYRFQRVCYVKNDSASSVLFINKDPQQHSVKFFHGFSCFYISVKNWWTEIIRFLENFQELKKEICLQSKLSHFIILILSSIDQLYADENTSETILHELAVDGKANIIKHLLENENLTDRLLDNLLLQGISYGVAQKQKAHSNSSYFYVVQHLIFTSV